MDCGHVRSSQSTFQSSKSSYYCDRTAYAQCNCQLVQPYPDSRPVFEANVLETTYTRVTLHALDDRMRFKTSSPSPVPLPSWSGQKTRRVREIGRASWRERAMSQILETLIDGLPSCEKLTCKV